MRFVTHGATLRNRQALLPTPSPQKTQVFLGVTVSLTGRKFTSFWAKNPHCSCSSLQERTIPLDLTVQWWKTSTSLILAVVSYIVFVYCIVKIFDYSYPVLFLSLAVPELPITVPISAPLVSPTRPHAPNFTSPNFIKELPWWCDFGKPGMVDTCGMVHDDTDRPDFIPNSGGTWTKNTGPLSASFQAHGKLSYSVPLKRLVLDCCV